MTLAPTLRRSPEAISRNPTLSSPRLPMAHRDVAVQAAPGRPRSLNPLYREANGMDTYRQMVDAMLRSPRRKSVFAVPFTASGSFRMPPTSVRSLARKVLAHMEPGISAEDCLYADLERPR